LLHQSGKEASVIGVIANSAEHGVISEFFELFKTPWEFYRSDRRYEVVLCATNRKLHDNTAKLVLLYAGHELAADAEENIEIASKGSNSMFSYKGTRIPIYGDSVTFREKGAGLLVDEESQQAAMHQRKSLGGVVARMGYNLFGEVGTLLTAGQPAAYAGIPTLDLHIALLRDLIVTSGVSLVEVPPVPNGYRFIACLTHDVDHPSIVQHKWDHTVFGFLYRAIFGSLSNFFRGRIPVRNLLTNWAAALKLPFVYMGFANDFWRDFEDRYRELEKGLCSTFFVIPFKNCPGSDFQGLAPKFRASRYGARDIAGTIGKILAAGCEVGLHGIDAWTDSSKGLEEFEEIRRLTGISETGVRMHWLYYDLQSPLALEQAGAAYDSTIGYRETVGYRAGTTQVYKPLEASRLLELPMHVMDTALFYPAYLGLSSRQATTLIRRMVDNAVNFGGCITINWHDRSLAPERVWDACYRDLVQDMKNRGAWFATAGQATSWFRKRRSIEFEMDWVGTNAPRPRASADSSDNLPGLLLRSHKAHESCRTGRPGSRQYVDMAFDESADNSVSR
jgi:peptidoglycan/xylan/chitin deacetylase (PgdA/CDA1 family)